MVKWALAFRRARPSKGFPPVFAQPLTALKQDAWAWPAHSAWIAVVSARGAPSPVPYPGSSVRPSR